MKLTPGQWYYFVRNAQIEVLQHTRTEMDSLGVSVAYFVDTAGRGWAYVLPMKNLFHDHNNALECAAQWHSEQAELLRGKITINTEQP